MALRGNRVGGRERPVRGRWYAGQSGGWAGSPFGRHAAGQGAAGKAGNGLRPSRPPGALPGPRRTLPRGPAEKLPPTVRTRSAIPAVPVPAETGNEEGPAPGSALRTLTRRCPPATRTRTSTRSPGACFAAFVRHSCTTRCTAAWRMGERRWADPSTRRSTGVPACSLRSASSGSASRPGVGAPSTPRRTMISFSIRCADRAVSESSSKPSSKSPPEARRASTCERTLSSVSSRPTKSCTSRAIRAAPAAPRATRPSRPAAPAAHGPGPGGWPRRRPPRRAHRSARPG